MDEQFSTPEGFAQFFIDADEKLNQTKRRQQEKADREYLEALKERVAKITADIIVNGNCHGALYIFDENCHEALYVFD